MRRYYFWFFAAAGIYFPYVSLYYKAIQLDGTQIGLLGIGAVIGSNLFGTLYDRLAGGGIFIVAALMVVPAWLGMLMFVPNLRAAEQISGP
jgi:predicted MFS family arabinose efflux permease